MSRRGELRVHVGDLLQRPGTQRRIARELAFEELAVAASRIPADTPVTADLVVESTADPGTLTVNGTVSTTWSGECRRCLDPIEGPLATEVHELAARRPLDEEIWELDGEELDLGAIVREALLLTLPLAPLCGDDCRGPAPEEFPAHPGPQPDAEADDEAEAATPRDPRWAALDELRFED